MLAHSHTELTTFKHVVFVDNSRHYVDCSDDVPEFMGYSRADFLAKTIDDLSYSLDKVPGLFKEFLRHGKLEGEYILRHSSGAPLPIRYRSFLFPDGCKAATWQPITDWRAAYLAALSESDAEKLGQRVDVALAAIYRTLYLHEERGAEPDHERDAIFEALSALRPLMREVPLALNPEFLAFEKTRSALLRLAERKGDSEAVRLLFHENQPLILSAIQEWFETCNENRILTAVLERVAFKARYYDPVGNPVQWLESYLKLECKRLRSEMDHLSKVDGGEMT